MVIGVNMPPDYSGLQASLIAEMFHFLSYSIVGLSLRPGGSACRGIACRAGTSSAHRGSKDQGCGYGGGC